MRRVDRIVVGGGWLMRAARAAVAPGLVALAMLAVLASTPVWAQDVATEVVTPQNVATATPASEPRIVLQRLEIDRSEILTEAELEAITERYVGRDMPVNDLYEMVAEIDELYASKGYLARAVLPEQTIEDGVVEVRLVEGRIGAVMIEGNRHTKTQFVADRIAVDAGDLVKLDAIEGGLLQFNDLYDAALHAELQAGEAFGTTDIVVHVIEPVNNDFSLSTDTSGRDEFGPGRYSFTWMNHSLLGYRDPLTLSISAGQGSQSGTLSYSVPVSRAGTRLGLSYAYALTQVIAGEFGDVGIHGDSTEITLYVDIPFRTQRDDALGLKISGNTAESKSYFENHKLIGYRLTTWTLTASGQFVRAPNHWGFAYIFTTGRDDVLSEPFSKHNIAGSYQRLLGDGSVLAFNVSGQLSDMELLPESERYRLGGVGTVRGFATGKLEGDEGYLINAEWTKPLLPWLQSSLYVDHGAVIPYKGNQEPLGPDDYVTTASVAFDVQITKYLSAQVSYGQAVDRNDPDGIFYVRLQADF